ncbi:hypothetical protein SFA71_07035 [Legionella pneumophila subsp. fraseri]|nr:hypothetical protein [Legionella pneumophila subsp. fraseri]MDW9063391.1 hypothetical protein [Legionella pneumophila subsp. fraseri]
MTELKTFLTKRLGVFVSPEKEKAGVQVLLLTIRRKKSEKLAPR